MSQAADIIVFMERTGSISAMEAFYGCGVTSLHRRLSDLRAMGYEFSEKWCGSGQKKYKRYSIKKRPKKARK